jgi:hypothetical protein
MTQASAAWTCWQVQQQRQQQDGRTAAQAPPATAPCVTNALTCMPQASSPQRQGSRCCAFKPLLLQAFQPFCCPNCVVVVMMAFPWPHSRSPFAPTTHCPPPPSRMHCVHRTHHPTDTGSVRVPKVHHVGMNPDGRGSFIVMEYLQLGGSVSQAALGRALAQMHLATPQVRPGDTRGDTPWVK